MLDFITFTAGEKTVSVSFKYSVIRGITPQSVEVYAGQTKDHGYQLLGKVPITVTNTTPAVHKRIAGTVSILVRKCRLYFLRLWAREKEKEKSQQEREISKLRILYLILCFSVLFLALGGIRLSLTVHAISNNLDGVVSNIDLICHLIENLCKTTQNDSVFHALSYSFFL